MARNRHCLLVNIGSPMSPNERDVATYLRQFLMDKYILRMPWILRFFLVNSMIVPRRKTHSSKKYAQVWKDGTFPLIANTQALVAKMKPHLEPHNIGVSFAMRHGSHSLEKEVDRLLTQGIDELLVIPMFPQYEKSTYQTVVDKVNKTIGGRCKVSYLPPFFENSDYIKILKNSIKEEIDGRDIDGLVYSFHGIPLKYLPCGEKVAVNCNNKIPSSTSSPYCRDCYKYQCLQSAKLISESLGIKDSGYFIGFQSRLGKDQWLYPSLRSEVSRLLKDGKSKIAVVSPSFTTDCLETLYEIDIELREEFMGGGGSEFYYIPTLNDSDVWAKKLSEWIHQ